MQTLVAHDALAWIQSRGFDTKDSPDPRAIFQSMEGHRTEFTIPTHGRAMLTLGLRLTDWLKFDTAMLWMSHWAPFEDDDTDFFLSVRRQGGSNLSLASAPVDVFTVKTPGDPLALKTILFHLMAMNWEGFVFRQDNGAAIWFGDEVVETVSQNEDHDSEVSGILAYLGLQPWDESKRWLSLEEFEVRKTQSQSQNTIRGSISERS